MFHVDRSYLLKMSGQLLKFKRVDRTLYKCRCPICGDSRKNKLKTRLYFYEYKNKMMVKCFNCSVSMAFSSFLKDQNPALYDEYLMEKFLASGRSVKKPELPASHTECVLKSQATVGLQPLLELPEGHTARVYVESRQIPKTAWDRLYYSDCIGYYVSTVMPWYTKEKNRSIPSDERLVWFLTDLDGQLNQVCARTLNPNPAENEIRYIKVRLHKEDTGKRRIFGLDNITDLSQPIVVVEGEIDSLFLPNCVAAGDSGLEVVADKLAVKYQNDNINLVIAWDNQPDNKEICGAMRKAIIHGHNVVIWPCSMTHKDINDMVKAGLDPEKIIKSHTYSGVEAEWHFNAWKKV